MARAPEAFSLEPSDGARPGARAGVAVVEKPDAFAEPPAPESDPTRGGRWSLWGRLFWSALGGFIALALANWAYGFVLDLMAKSPALGYLALALALLAALSLLALAGREVAALVRLGSAARMRAQAEAAFASGDDRDARAFLSSIAAFYRRDPATARARAALEAHSREIIDGPNLVLLAERELLKEKDEQAREAIGKASGRVAMVTTVSPRAWVDVGFVLAQSFMLISRVATIYSGRPGGLAIWRLSARVAAHLAITGGVAVATDALSQFLGAGLVSRISSKLGEGVLNGVLTARVGLSAIAVCRPMPFRALAPPALADVAGSLMSGGETAKPAG